MFWLTKKMEFTQTTMMIMNKNFLNFKTVLRFQSSYKYRTKCRKEKVWKRNVKIVGRIWRKM